jgi:23S rRNA (adenine2503-C2)-methyltransferase
MSGPGDPVGGEQAVLRREARMIFTHPDATESVVVIEVLRTRDEQRVETVAYSGADYEDETYISVTTQIGCPVRCDFCKVSELALVRNVTVEEYVAQVARMLESGSFGLDQRPLKISFGRAGEPLLNRNTVVAMQRMAELWEPSFQVFSVMPDNLAAHAVREELLEFAAEYPGTVQLVISMHSTDERQRGSMMPYRGRLLDFERLAAFGARWASSVSRQISLSFALMDDATVDLTSLARVFEPSVFAVRFALYVPSSSSTLARHAPSPIERLRSLGKEARALGYLVIESPAGPIERIWDSRPYSGFRMLVETVGTALE